MAHLLAAVFLLSFSALAFEVLLARVFSITQWNHLAFMVISIALFGFAASGTFLKVMGSRRGGWERRFIAAGPLHAITILFSAACLLAFTTLSNLPLDYFRLSLEPVQAVYLLTAYLALALPFFFSGLSVSLAYAAVPERTGRVYLATMAGSAAGALFPALLLPLMDESRLVVVCALIPLCGSLFCLRRNPRGAPAPPRRCWPLVVSAAIVSAAVLLLRAGMMPVRPSDYKDLSQLLQFPDTRITASTTDIRGRVDRVESPFIRFAPGLSLTFTDRPPRQSALFTDGDARLVLYHLNDAGGAKFCRHSLPYAGYVAAGAPESVLVIAQNGGSALPCALAAEARDITVLAPNPTRARAIAAHYGVATVSQNPRVFLSRSEEKFSVIHLDDWGPAVPGTAALTQDYLLTVDAFAAYLDHLHPRGRIIVSRRLLLPPADSVRLWAAAREALQRRGADAPERHLAMLRNWDAFTLVVSPDPLVQIPRLKDFARRMNFDFVYAPGLDPQDANRFNRFDRPYHHDTLAALAQAYAASDPAAFFDAYPLDAAPQTDSRPYPHRFMKWSTLADVYQSTGRRLYALLLSGEVVVTVLFVEALAVALLLLVLPLLGLRRGEGRPPAGQVAFFLGVGAGFMFAELFFIKAYTLIFGNAVISFTVVLAGLLVFSAVGGLWSETRGPGSARPFLGLLILLLAANCLWLGGLSQRMLAWPPAVRQTVAVLLLAPTGFLMGLPFALGMRYFPSGPAQRAVAWTANGCASVLAAIAAAQIAVSLGIPAVLAFAVAAYLAAWLAAAKTFAPRIVVTAGGPPARPGRGRQTSGCRRSGIVAAPMYIAVDCHAGFRGEETPRRIRMGRQAVAVSEVLDRWLAPDHRYFKVLGEDDAVYILRHDADKGTWELISFNPRG